MQVLALTWAPAVLPDSVFCLASLRNLELECEHVVHLPRGLRQLKELQARENAKIQLVILRNLGFNMKITLRRGRQCFVGQRKP